MHSGTFSIASGIRFGVPEQVTVQNAEEVRTDLLSFIAPGTGGVVLDLAAVKKVDVTFFQLLFALEASLGATGRHLSVIGIDGDRPVRRSAGLLGIDIDRFKGASGAAE